ncbi:hypothetical protein Tco_1521325, partial [Tanacetum coccineum]
MHWSSPSKPLIILSRRSTSAFFHSLNSLRTSPLSESLSERGKGEIRGVSTDLSSDL